MVTGRSFKQFRLAPVYPPAPTNAAGTSLVEANDNALPLRISVYGALRLAGRIALAQLWPIILPGRAVAAALNSQSIFMAKRRPSAVSVVASRTPLSVSAGHLVALSVEAQQSPTGAHAECTGSAEIVQRSTAL